MDFYIISWLLLLLFYYYYYIITIISTLYTDWFYAFGRLSKRPKFIQYSCIQFTGHWAQYIYTNFLLDIYNTLE